MKKSLYLAFYTLLALCGVIFYYAFVSTTRIVNSPWHTVFVATYPHHTGSPEMEVGFYKDSLPGGLYYYFLRVRQAQTTKSYFMSDADSHLENLQIKASSAQTQRIWVEDKAGGVICCLDMKSGKLINAFRAVVDPDNDETAQMFAPRPRDDNTGPWTSVPFPAWVKQPGEALSTVWDK